MLKKTCLAFLLNLTVLAHDAHAVDLIGKVKGFFDPPVASELKRYGTDPEQQLLVYRPPKPKNLVSLEQERTPAVILIHGGGWSIGKKEQMEEYAQVLAKAGYTVVNIDYRLARKGDSHTYWPAQLQDVQLAARWVRANYQTLGIDPQRLCAVGGSAGGHLAMELGYRKETEPGDRSEVLKGYSSSVNCVVTICGPANIEYPYFANLVNRDTHFMGKKTPQEAPAYWRSASPIHNIRSDSAPTLVIQNRGDTTVPPAMADELMAKLKEFNVPSERADFDGEHVFINAPQKIKNQAFEKMIEFLGKYNSPGGSEAVVKPAKKNLQ